jgi:hypothetical protein
MVSIRVNAGGIEEEVAAIVANSKQKKLVHTPQMVTLIQHLQDDIFAFHKFSDIFALHEFFESTTPPEVQARRQAVHLLLYGFADASGGGLGSTITITVPG